jgi:predicted site-specific integrase-resolvase
MSQKSEPIDPEALAAVAELPPLVPLAKVAEFFGVAERTCREWARTPGKLRVVKTSPGGSGRVLVARTEVARLLSTMTQRQIFDPV